MNDFEPMTVLMAEGQTVVREPVPQRVAFSHELLRPAPDSMIWQDGEGGVTVRASNGEWKFRMVRTDPQYVVCERVA